MKVLLPIDIAHPPNETIEQLPIFAKPEGTQVHLIYVKEELPSYERGIETIGAFEDDWSKQLEAKALVVFADVEKRLKEEGYSVSSEILTGPPAAMIDAVARDEGFDMIAQSPGRHSRVEMFFLGSVTSAVVKHSPGICLICRHNRAPQAKLNSVVMGIDGSEQSHFAVAEAADKLNINKTTKITLIHSVTIADAWKLVSPVEYIGLVENNLLMEGETYLADGKRILADKGFTNVEIKLKEGDPASEIIKLAGEVDADLVVIGSQGRTAIQHFVMGSVSHRIAMRCPCATAIIKQKKS